VSKRRQTKEMVRIQKPHILEAKLFSIIDVPAHHPERGTGLENRTGAKADEQRSPLSANSLAYTRPTKNV